MRKRAEFAVWLLLMALTQQWFKHLSKKMIKTIMYSQKKKPFGCIMQAKYLSTDLKLQNTIKFHPILFTKEQ